jgi:hypothetical protein
MSRFNELTQIEVIKSLNELIGDEKGKGFIS